MAYATSKHLGYARDRDGKVYSLRFYGEADRRAVVTGPNPRTEGALMPEVYAEPALDTVDARTKLVAWITATGWTLLP